MENRGNNDNPVKVEYMECSGNNDISSNGKCLDTQTISNIKVACAIFVII